MKIKFIKEASGIAVGTEKEVSSVLAKPLIEMGIAEEVKSAPKKEAAPEMETKEEKTVSKRRTKARK